LSSDVWGLFLNRAKGGVYVVRSILESRNPHLDGELGQLKEQELRSTVRELKEEFNNPIWNAAFFQYLANGIEVASR